MRMSGRMFEVRFWGGDCRPALSVCLLFLLVLPGLLRSFVFSFLSFDSWLLVFLCKGRVTMILREVARDVRLLVVFLIFGRREDNDMYLVGCFRFFGRGEDNMVHMRLDDRRLSRTKSTKIGLVRGREARRAGSTGVPATMICAQMRTCTAAHGSVTQSSFSPPRTVITSRATGPVTLSNHVHSHCIPCAVSYVCNTRHTSGNITEGY